MNATATSVLGLRFLGGLALLAVGAPFCAELLVRGGWHDAAATGAVRIEQGMLAFAAAGLLVIAFARWQRPGLPWAPARARAVVAAYVPFVLAWTLLLVGYLMVMRNAGAPVPPQAQLDYFAAAPVARPAFWLVVGATTLVGPIAEEIVFRGFLQTALAGVVRPWLAIAISAVVFGLVHTLPYALPVALLGAFFGCLAQRCGSLWPAVLAHMLHNGVVVLVTAAWPRSLELLYPR